jgi:hypothetical protein
MGKERRALCRFEPRELTTATLNETRPESAQGVLSNISELGVCLTTDAHFAPGRDVEVLLHLNRLSVLIQADARVVWARSDRGLKDRSEGSILIGTQFIWMPHADRRCLQWALTSEEFIKEPSFDATSSFFALEGDLPGNGNLLSGVPSSLPFGSMRNGVRHGRVQAKQASRSSWRDKSGTFDGVVLIVREGTASIERLCRIVKAAGFNPVLTNSPETVVSKVRALKPSLVLFSQNIGHPGVSETARRIKNHPGRSDTPVAILTEGEAKPFLNDSAYPVEACVALDVDAATLVKNVRLLARKRSQSEEERWGALEGNIEKNTLADVLQYLSTAGKTGRMTIRAGRRTGCVYLDGGDLVHAHYGPLVGIEACHAIVCRLQEGYFRFEPNVRPARTTMRENGLELILEAAKQMDEITRRRHPMAVRLPET